MSEWVDLLKYLWPAVVSGIGGWFAHHAWVRKRLLEAKIRQQERDAAYEEVKKLRRLTGAGDVQKIERAKMVTALAIEQENHGLTGERWDEAQERILGKSRKRTKAETTDPVPPGEVGPSGGPIEYMPNGDKVEWIIGADANGSPIKRMKILRRNDAAILEALDRLSEFFVWKWSHNVLKFDPALMSKHVNLPLATEIKQRIEETWGKERLEKMLTFEQSQLTELAGQLNALAWVVGEDWEGLKV